MSTIVTVSEVKCQKCYACVQNCPVKAIKVKDSKAEIVTERCISCGYCLSVCSQGAKRMKDYQAEIAKWRQYEEKLIACLAPSFIASFTECKPQQVVTALQRSGFEQVYKVSLGARMLLEDYDDYLVTSELKNLISTACPAITNLIERYYPELVPNLIPLVSPMIAVAKLIKKEHPKSRVVFIGPCVAKKSEIKQEEATEIIDAVLTFKEIKEIFRNQGIEELRELELSSFALSKLPHSDNFPLAGGLVANLDSLSADEALITEGSQSVIRLLEAISEEEIEVQLLDLLFCQGCIDGPEIDSQLSIFAREKLINEFLEKQGVSNKESSKEDKLPSLDFSRQFERRVVELPMPNQEEIEEILNYTNKFTESDLLNCGVCGYSTCREKAIAVYQDLAEIEMCLPYLLEEFQKEVDYYKEKLSLNKDTKYSFRDIKGKSQQIKKLKAQARQAAQTRSTILILGESGTGKELFAHAIHNASPRRSGPFVKVNCAAIADTLLETELFGYEKGAFTGARQDGKAGKFELADQGTIFLDEIGDMPLQMQAKILRVLQEKEIERVGGNEALEVDLRIIAATNCDLHHKMKKNKFREDLYYRLNVITIKIPPLRERIEDLPVIVDYIITKLVAEEKIPRKKLSNEVLVKLMSYDWPGNIRELENLIIQTFSLATDEIIKVKELPNYIIEQSSENNSGLTDRVNKETGIRPLGELVAELEKEAIQKTLNLTKGNKKKAAELLQISRSTLYQKLDRYSF